MKTGIHPTYKQSTITCACGAVAVTRSTRGSFTTDVCSKCHPFYTGKHKVMDVAGRVDRFRKRYANNGLALPTAPGPAESTESATPST